MSPEPVAIAFSGGLDTSWLVARFAEEGHEVTAITVNTGGWDDDGLRGAVAIYQDPAELLARYPESLFSAGRD
jgi:tRNA U34 2-thiouridine synthase MnmA/TrmU